MVKYIIEDNIDFFNELYKSISNEESNGKKKQEENEQEQKEQKEQKEQVLCLISNMPLIEHFITMECGHKFNYIPLYNDILNHKKKFNTMENKILKTIEIRCPYCRKVQQNLLPYYKYPGVKEVHGVNYFDPNIILKNPCACCEHNMKYIIGKCEYKMMEEGKECINTSVLLLEQNGKHYCLYHKYKMSNELAKKLKLDKIIFKKKQLEEEKQKIKYEKIKAKDEKIKAKDEKMKEKEELKKINKKIKEEAKSVKLTKVNKNENVVLSVMCCTQILKKGGTCKQKQHTGTLCLKHYNINCA